jgi:hypothetical protein
MLVLYTTLTWDGAVWRGRSKLQGYNSITRTRLQYKLVPSKGPTYLSLNIHANYEQHDPHVQLRILKTLTESRPSHRRIK